MNPDTQPPVKSEDELRQKIRSAITAPLRSEVSTADFAVFGMSSTKLAEVVFDIEQLVKQEAERHADAVIGRDDEPRNTLEHSRRNFLRSEQRNRNHYQLKEKI